ncbi:MAG: YjgN family protein, partial [Usitatibacteraceae bacterium]
SDGADAAIADAAPPPIPVEPAPAAAEIHPFRFTGTAGEFFGIWIVNLFLTIITLGIYSAWAKVRKKRYFYGHTWVADANFEYHGNPIAILKGRLIAVAAFATYSGVGHFMPKVAAVLALLLFCAAPWFIARSMAFNAFNSSYRNIRFRFHATYMDVLKAIWPIALVLIFPLLMPDWDPASKTPPPTSFWVIVALQMVAIFAVYPYAIGGLKKLHVNHSQYGTAPFSIGVGIGAFYKIYFLTILVVFGVIVAISVVVGIITAVIVGIAAASSSGGGTDGGKLMAVLGGIIGVFAVMVIYFAIGTVVLAYTKSRMGNLVFNNTRLDGHVTFISNLKLRKLAWIYLVNILAILFSMGLAVPWAVIRVMRYRAECLALQSPSAIDQFISGVSAQVSATGEELGEFFSIDLSL